tara:strand:- start:202 stop:930 length:729 start_codon:yes stop_codon:yes gene_type:complete
MNIKKKILFILGCCGIFFNSFGQNIFPDVGADMKSLIPEGYSFENATIGDLNQDNNDDLVIIVENKVNGVLNKVIAIYFQSKNPDFFESNYVKHTESVIYTSGYASYVTLLVKNNKLILYTSSSTSSRPQHYYKFQLRNDFFELIGFDYTWYSTHCHYYSMSDSFNFLTNKKQTLNKINGIPKNEEELNNCSIPSEMIAILNKNNWKEEFWIQENWKTFNWSPLIMENFNFDTTWKKIQQIW